MDKKAIGVPHTLGGAERCEVRLDVVLCCVVDDRRLRPVVEMNSRSMYMRVP